MLTAWKGGRSLILVVVGVVILIFVFSQTWHSDTLGWSDISSSLPIAGKKEKCPECPTPPGPRRPPAHLHYFIAGSTSNLQLCRALVSSTVNRYGAPVISGWQATGDKDAGVTHLAKVRVITEYLEKMDSEADDDLFLMIDGYDVQLQFGPEVLIQRYFQTSAKEDERLIQQLGPANAEKIAGPLGRHIFFGADKVCWPVDWRRPACWAVPLVPGMDNLMFGPKTDNGDLVYNRPRWLNSGTIMGPVKEVRDLFRATLDRINSTYSTAYDYRESDQYYMAEIWGEQEIERINAQLAENPDASHPRGPSDAFWPKIQAGKKYNYHIAIDYWSDLFQTWAGYTDFVNWHKFDGPGYSFAVDQNVRGDTNFKPWQLHLQGDAMTAMGRVFASTRDPSMGRTSNELIRKSEFGHNVVTRSTIPVWHCTGGKGALEEFWPRQWFYAHAKAMIRSALAFFKGGEPYTPYPIDNRLWYPAVSYPADARLDDAGAWSDGSADSGKVEWLSFDKLCKDHKGALFG